MVRLRNQGSISVSGQLPTDPSPNPTLTLTCCQLAVVHTMQCYFPFMMIQCNTGIDPPPFLLLTSPHPLPLLSTLMQRRN